MGDAPQWFEENTTKMRFELRWKIPNLFIIFQINENVANYETTPGQNLGDGCFSVSCQNCEPSIFKKKVSIIYGSEF